MNAYLHIVQVYKHTYATISKTQKSQSRAIQYPAEAFRQIYISCIEININAYIISGGVSFEWVPELHCSSLLNLAMVLAMGMILTVALDLPTATETALDSGQDLALASAIAFILALAWHGKCMRVCIYI